MVPPEEELEQARKRKRRHQTILANDARKRRQEDKEAEFKHLHERIAALLKTNDELLQFGA